MCDQLSDNNILDNINKINDYIISNCDCRYCKKINNRFNAMKIIVNFCIQSIRKYRRSKKNYHIKYSNLSKNTVDFITTYLIFHDIFKININTK